MTSGQMAEIAEASLWDQADDYWSAKYDEYAAGWPNDDDFYEHTAHECNDDGFYEEG